MHRDRPTPLKPSRRALLSDPPPSLHAVPGCTPVPLPVDHTAASAKVEELLCALKLSRSDASEADAARAAQIDAAQAAAQLARMGGCVCATPALCCCLECRIGRLLLKIPGVDVLDWIDVLMSAAYSRLWQQS